MPNGTNSATKPISVENIKMIAAFFFAASISIFAFQYYLDGGRFDIFNPKTLFQIYFLIQLPLALLLGVGTNAPGFVYLSQSTSDNHVFALGVLFFIAQFVMVLSYYLIGKKRLHFQFIRANRWSYRRVGLVYYLVLAAGYLSFFFLLKINGGYSEFISSREAWRAGGMSGQGWLIFPCTSMIAMASISYIIAFAKIFRGRTGAIKLIFLIGVTIFPASQLGFRGLMLLPIMQILFIYHHRVGKLQMRRVIPLLVALALIFTFYGLYREASSYTRGNVDVNAISQVIIEQPELLYSVFLRSKGADVVASALGQIETNGDYLLFLPGIVETLTIPIPSIIWPGKPVPLSVQFSEQFFGVGGGVSPTVVGEAYWNGGLIGVLIVMVAIGFAFRFYINSVRCSGGNDSTLLFLASIFPSLIMMAEAIQGYVNGIFFQLIFTSMLSFIFSVRLSKRNHSQTISSNLTGSNL